jgi:hypothetical protein
MVLETVPQDFGEWLSSALVHWLLIVATAGLLFGVMSLMTVLVLGRHDGLDRAWSRFVSRLGSTFEDLFRLSPRRVWALARLSMQESIRRRGLIGFVLFGFFVLPFGLWFLDPQSPAPAVLYIGTIQWAVTILVLVTAWLMSATSLPADLKNKTMFTIVTKPVRASEIVLGRILGISAICTVMLAVMGVLSYVFVHRALDHTHELTSNDLSASEAPSSSDVRTALEGRTSVARGHSHRVRVDADGLGATDVTQGHWHRITGADDRGQLAYSVGGPLGQFRARVPIYGTLRFNDRAGHATARGVDIGEWTSHRYIEGGTLAAAIWTFDGVTPEAFPQGLRIDLNILVFRTHKGDIERGIAGSLVLRNPRTQLSSAPYNFIAKEFVIDPHLLPRKLADSAGDPIDLFNDLVVNGELEVVVQCLEHGQFFGMAQPDAYLLASEGSVPLNFFKGYAGIWMQMVLIVTVGVMWSTFLNAAVALLATAGTLFVGYLGEFIRKLSSEDFVGGATFESLVRMVQQKNLKVPLDDTWTTHVINFLDEIVRWCLWTLLEVTPDLRIFNNADALAQGFDIRAGVLGIQAVSLLGYALPMFIVGYICFKFREVAQ